MKTKSIEYKVPENKEDCFGLSCLVCYYWHTDRGECEKFYRDKMNAGIYGSEIPKEE